ncbi:MAG: RNA 2',3'-cyclic phosphodiesterase [Chitinophagales bacterium]
MHRLFFAIPLPDGLREKFSGLVSREKLSLVKWVSTKNLHITVHFLGATHPDQFSRIIKSGKEISASTSSFVLKLDCFETILENRKPVMIWAQFEKSDTFEKLCLQLRKALPTEETRKPVPHATLARIRQLKQLPFDLPAVHSGSFSADQPQLIESLTHPDDAAYRVIESWELK